VAIAYHTGPVEAGRQRLALDDLGHYATE